jgi:hypothetical protein
MLRNTCRFRVNSDNFSSLWETLPSLNASRSFHGCDRIFSGKTRYLVVYGGRHFVGQTPTNFGDVMFLDMKSKSEGWYSVPGIQMNKLISNVNGGLIKQLSTGT